MHHSNSRSPITKRYEAMYSIERLRQEQQRAVHSLLHNHDVVLAIYTPQTRPTWSAAKKTQTHEHKHTFARTHHHHPVLLLLMMLLPFVSWLLLSTRRTGCCLHVSLSSDFFLPARGCTGVGTGDGVREVGKCCCLYWMMRPGGAGTAADKPTSWAGGRGIYDPE